MCCSASSQRGLDDAETFGMLARTHKDLGLRASNSARRVTHLRAGFELYERASRRRKRAALADAYYTGINAATMAVLLETSRARISSRTRRWRSAARPSKGRVRAGQLLAHCDAVKPS
jgi:hypothetical protein